MMTDPILYLSMILGLGGVYVLIASFNDDDDDSDDDGEKYLFNLEYAKGEDSLNNTKILLASQNILWQYK